MTQSGVNWTQAQQPMRLRSKTSPTNVQGPNSLYAAEVPSPK